MKQSYQVKEKGFALLLALIISSVVLAIGVSILHISVNQINLSATARESEFAFQSAHAGIDCMWYWRNEKASEFLNTTTNPPPAPSVSCFDTTPITQTASRVLSNSTGIVTNYYNMFEWGSPARCTEVSMYVMSPAGTSDVTLEFENRGVGDGGTKTCESGTTCTVLISDGFNRSCSEVDTSIFSVQRELTVEF
jgi:hypothetical protein